CGVESPSSATGAILSPQKGIVNVFSVFYLFQTIHTILTVSFLYKVCRQLYFMPSAAFSYPVLHATAHRSGTSACPFLKARADLFPAHAAPSALPPEETFPVLLFETSHSYNLQMRDYDQTADIIPSAFRSHFPSGTPSSVHAGHYYSEYNLRSASQDKLLCPFLSFHDMD